MSQKTRWAWRKRIMLVGITLWSGILAAFLLAILAFGTEQPLLGWLAAVTFEVTLVLMTIALLVAAIALPAAVIRQKRTRIQERQARE